MLVVTLDESGDFERRENEPHIIAGPIFQCESEENQKAELTRLEQWFKEKCRAAGVRYPYDLHLDWEKTNSDPNSRVLGQLWEDLPCFLQESQHGTYYVYAMLGFEPRRANTTTAAIVDDRRPSNFYERLVRGTVTNLFFRNDVFKDEKAKFRPATRVFRGDTAFHDAINGGPRSRSTDTSWYRNLVAMALSNRPKRSGEVKITAIRATQIEYETGRMLRTEPRDYGFLYLADVICGKLRQSLTANNIERFEWVDGLNRCGENLVGTNRFLLWVDDPINDAYAKAWDSYAWGDCFGSAKHLSEIPASQSPVREYYEEKWINPLLEKMKAETSPVQLSKAFIDLNAYLEQPEYDFDLAQRYMRN